ncbi:hypothetical protein HELRODRAFT_165284 [Helobdella robusta]|uniref:TTF-type domain-containing protein n=1 Tax=Helobdella robusta TaxID=6412 RepID=T1EWJ3_HELRO|nr:hypothetical protein HELRODRAFT_165284 [Helobdella robusta]ESN91282.1 hypothetical protein HELRODRAFT_165284 [Helobdella robusta]
MERDVKNINQISIDTATQSSNNDDFFEFVKVVDQSSSSICFYLVWIGWSYKLVIKGADSMGLGDQTVELEVASSSRNIHDIIEFASSSRNIDDNDITEGIIDETSNKTIQKPLEIFSLESEKKKKKHTWLKYEPVEDKIFCEICQQCDDLNLFQFLSKQNHAFARNGFNNWKHALEKFKAHEKSLSHQEAVLKINNVNQGTNALSQQNSFIQKDMIIKDVLSRFNISFHKCRGQCFYGAANMGGKIKESRQNGCHGFLHYKLKIALLSDLCV